MCLRAVRTTSPARLSSVHLTTCCLLPFLNTVRSFQWSLRPNSSKRNFSRSRCEISYIEQKSHCTQNRTRSIMGAWQRLSRRLYHRPATLYLHGDLYDSSQRLNCWLEFLSLGLRCARNHIILHSGSGLIQTSNKTPFLAWVMI
jgi:hypothetical protein